MKRIYFFCLIICIFVSVPAFSEEKMRVAIIDIQAKNVPNVVAMGVSNMIRSDFVDSGLFTVIERNQMAAIIKEQELQMTGCTDNACAVQVGKLLSARKIMVGEITKIGKAYFITVRIVDVERGVAEFSSKEKAESDDTLDKAASTLTAKLIGRITGKTKSELLAGLEKRTMTGYWLRSIVPGWGQFYSGNSGKGYTFLGAFVLASGFMGYAIYNFNVKRGEYEDMTTGSESDFKEKHDAAGDAAKLAWISVGIFTGLYLIHWMDALFFSRPDYDRFAERPGMIGSNNLSLSFNVYNLSSSSNKKYYNMGISLRF